MAIRSVLLLRTTSAVDKVDHPQFFDPCYPLKYIQAGLKRVPGLEVHMLDCWIHPQGVSSLLERASEILPDLVVISASSFDVGVADEFAARLKRSEKPPIIVGIGQGYYTDTGFDAGPASSAAEGPSNGGAGSSNGGNGRPSPGGRESYDALLLGEPEEAFFDLFDRMRGSKGGGSSENGNGNAGWKEHFGARYAAGHRFTVEEPDKLPFPSYTSEELDAYRSIFPVRLAKRVRWGYTIAMRGCPYSCEFCSEVMRVSVGKRMRVRSAKNVADEMEHMVRSGVNIISFQDDSFASSKRFVRALCEELIARGSTVHWMARVRVDEVDREMLELMSRAGCILLGIGVESGSQRIIDEVRKSYRKTDWPALCRKVFRWTKEIGIGTNAYYVIGNPTETREEIQQTIDLAMELNSDSIQVHFYTPYPGSVAWLKYKDKIAEHAASRMFHYATPQFTFANVSVEELLELRSKFYKRYIMRPRFAIYHLWKHAGFYMKNPDIFKTLLGIRKVL